MSSRETVFVTGGSGFIGAAVVAKLLESGRRCVVLDRVAPEESDCEFRPLDIMDLAACTEALAGAENVVHLAGLVAGPANASPHQAVAVNILGTANVLEACRTAGAKRVVYASTFFVYEDCGLDEVDETTQLDLCPMGPFARSKFVCEQIARDYEKKYKLSTAGLRIGSVYGPGRGSNVVNDFVAQAVRGEEIVVWGEGRRHRQFVFVDDIGDAALSALTSTANGAFNIAGAEQTTTREVLEAIAARLPSTKVSFDATKSEKVQPYRMRLERARTEIGWEPRTSIAEGIDRTLAWFSKASFQEGAPEPAPRPAPSHPAKLEKATAP